MSEVTEILRSIGSRELDELKHYASQYYDPAKAKEYYERTKKLKGREPALTETQRSASTLVKKNIATARKDETQTNRDAQTARLEEIRGKAEAARQAVQKKLDGIAKELDAKVNDIASALKTVPLNKIPPNASPKVRAFLEKQNKHIRNANTAKAQKQVKVLADIANAARRDVAEQRKAIGDDMRGALQKARDAYTTQVATTKKKYDTAVDTELNNIRTQVK